ncbi:MAG: Long-chain-fatty-acid--CoA ligase [uncultured Rubrobacteraceae bacterium]|uniref:Long-chain-fatty-acid--CoA ligase n=1 Tax=uncultured Rubrobacteraceae bacterium TaxID=349277 RepID=A0A6J4QLK2_9ACTN|nr:MAG: Long-chain-fatty-acid--CoA ligase [uncultured Rubrobacteraceae bacterium]
MQADIARSIRNTIGDGLRRSARRDPDKTALVFDERTWTFAELDGAANRVANALLERGLEKGDRVAAYGHNSDAYVIAWLGCTRAGLVHVPVNYALAGEELLYILDQSGSKALFYDTALAEAVEAVRDEAGVGMMGTLHGGDGFDLLEVARRGDDSEPGVKLRDDDVAQLLYTSGTTAAPKGAMLTHRALMAEYVSCMTALEYHPDDRAIAALPLYHSAQMHVFLMPLLLIGGTNHIVVAPDPEECCGIIEREEINSMFAPPTVWIGFLRHPAFDSHDLSSLQKLQYGASIMPVPVLKELRERLPNSRLYNCYGQSEISPLATVLRPEEHQEERLASAGRPVLNVETRVVDPEMNDAPAGEHGEIVHRSPHLMVGYWEKQEETGEVFAGGWFHSGDLGYMDEDGYLYVVDRVKDVINTGGVQVAGREVEEALYGHEAVSEVAVIALPDEKWIEAVTAVVVLKEGAEPDKNLAGELETHAREHLAPFKVPKHVFFVDDLPRNTAGKILKRELRERFAQEV